MSEAELTACARRAAVAAFCWGAGTAGLGWAIAALLIWLHQ